MEDKKQQTTVTLLKDKDGVTEYSFEVEGELPQADNLPQGSENWTPETDQEFLEEWFNTTDNGMRGEQGGSSFDPWAGRRDEETGESQSNLNRFEDQTTKASHSLATPETNSDQHDKSTLPAPSSRGLLKQLNLDRAPCSSSELADIETARFEEDCKGAADTTAKK